MQRPSVTVRTGRKTTIIHNRESCGLPLERGVMRTSRILASAVVVGGLYAIGAMLSYRYLSVPESGASFFPAAGITLAVLLSTPRRSVAVLAGRGRDRRAVGRPRVQPPLGVHGRRLRDRERRRTFRRRVIGHGMCPAAAGAQPARIPPLVRPLCRRRRSVRRWAHRRHRHDDRQRKRAGLDGRTSGGSATRWVCS